MNATFWQHPPWAGAPAKHRLGLAPVTDAAVTPAAPATQRFKRHILQTHYHAAVAATPTSRGLQEDLCKHLGVAAHRYADRIADVAVGVEEDLCLLEVGEEVRFVAGCVCAPSYWFLQEKIGGRLRDVHAPVPGLNGKIGSRVDEFLKRLPPQRVFERSNWFVHTDPDLFHPHPDVRGDAPPGEWFVRCEIQRFRRLSPRAVLFTIRIVIEPLAQIFGFPAARQDMAQALKNMDKEEIDHFGGRDKVDRLLVYLRTNQRSGD